MPDDRKPADERLERALQEIETLRAEKERLERENARLRGLLRTRRPETMSTKLYDALRE
ncbi:hypothetical protein [Paenibacillus humicola]|uniref:hypothetical protein n=1 Tax=Paenibacillus humicola TaxID=3110540 RepID=UPI00237AB1EB|nr:hypothetical protein [Paenibacillus humicola]